MNLVNKEKLREAFSCGFRDGLWKIFIESGRRNILDLPNIQESIEGYFESFYAATYGEADVTEISKLIEVDHELQD